MLPIIVNVKRTLLTGGVLLAIALAGSFATNAVLNGPHQSEVTANIPNTLVLFTSLVLRTLQLLGTVLIAIAIVVRLNRTTKIDPTRPDPSATDYEEAGTLPR